MPQLIEQALAFHQAGRLTEAEALYLQILRANPADFPSRHLLGVMRYQQERHGEALALIVAALRVNPHAADALVHQGLVLQALERLEQALASFDKALAVDPGMAEAWFNRGNVLHGLGRSEEALESFDKALVIRPDYAEALNSRGTVLLDLKRYAESLAAYDKALAVRPNYDEAFYNRGNVLAHLKRLEEALENYDRALAIKPGFGALYNRGIALLNLKRFEEALASYSQALAIDPGHAEALHGRGMALWYLENFEEALDAYDKVLAIEPDHVEALYGRGMALQELKRFEEALAVFEKALALAPDHANVFGNMATMARVTCDWRRTRKYSGEMHARIVEGKSVVPPFTLLGYEDDPALQREYTAHFVQAKIMIPPRPLWEGGIFRNDKIRIAYLSSDFRDHPVGHMIAGLLESHDRSRFEIFAIAFDDGAQRDMRLRLVKAVDQFHDVRHKNDAQAALLVNQLGVDIAVDLNGYTRGMRPEILAHRPAPIQVNYLGYPSTMAAGFMDYVIGDEIVLPYDRQNFYSEKIVHLPDCYLANDSRRPMASPPPSRREVGLPEQGFVFCCFNNNWKITAPLFDIWMRLLQMVPDSVLWLLVANPAARENLVAEAQARHVAPDRLVFAERMERPEYLMRLAHADLFLDTLPYNAHATGGEFLNAGVPVLTCTGKNFPARVGASLLTAAGLPELVTDNLEDYEALALRLARDPALLASIRQKLERNRLTGVLFDADRYRRHIEAAYTTMWETWQRGEPARSFAVAPIEV